jgi:hypothetical protein
MEDQEKVFREFIMAEYNRYADLFKFSEEAGEKRLTFYMSLVTAIVGGIVALYAKGDIGETCDFSFLAILILIAQAGLLSVGHLVYMRMVKRNETTDNCKENMDLVRKIMIDAYKGAAESLKEFKRIGENQQKPNRKPGSLRDIVAMINIFLIIFLAGNFIYMMCLSSCCSSAAIFAVTGILCLIPVLVHLRELIMDYYLNKSKSKNTK